MVKQYYSSTKTYWQITTVYWFHTPPYNGHLRLYWATYAWVTLICQFASIAYIFVKTSTTNYFSIMRQLLNAFWISSIQHARPELSALQWIRPMAKWHPCRAVFWTINAGANLLSVYWIPNRRLKGSLRDYLRMCRNCFDPVADISEQPKTAHWIEKISSFNMVCITSNISERIAAESRPELLHWILNIILY